MKRHPGHRAQQHVRLAVPETTHQQPVAEEEREDHIELPAKKAATSQLTALSSTPWPGWPPTTLYGSAKIRMFTRKMPRSAKPRSASTSSIRSGAMSPGCRIGS